MEVPSGVIIHIGRETAAWSLWVYAMWGEEDRGRENFLTADLARNGGLVLLASDDNNDS